MKIYIKLGGIFTVVLLLLGATAEMYCSDGNRSGEQKAGGTVRIALHSARGEIFPYSITESGMRQISEYILSPSLIRYDASGREEAVLAASWEIADDKRSITYYLRPDVKWSNGDPFNTSDVRFSFHLATNPDKKYRLSSQLSPVRDIVIIDDLTCRFEFIRPVANPLYHTKLPILPAAWQQYLTHPGEIEKQYIKNFIGCGPYLLQSVNDDSLVCKRNTSDPGQIPHLKNIVILFSQALAKGSHPLPVHMEVNVPLEEVSQYQSDSLYQIMTYPERGYSFIAWNLKNKLLSEYQIRKAFSLGIDKATIVDGVLAGFGSVIDAPAYSGFPDFNSQVFKYGNDPVRARTILDSLGWHENDLGIRTRAGRQLRFKLKINHENQMRGKVALNIVKDLAAIGINVDLEIVPWEDIVSSITRKNFDAMIITWVDDDRYDPSDLFHTAGIVNGLNLTSYSNPYADSLIEQGLNDLDYEGRSRAWQEFQDVIARDLPCTFLFNQKIIAAVRTNLNGVEMDGRGYLVTLKDWWLSDR